MPSLKDLSCSIELGSSQQTLQEHGTTYGDTFVETFVAAPTEPTPFGVRLTSGAFIAEGLAMYVYINGVYQCNRNRHGLVDRQRSSRPLDRRTLINFLVRKKEEKQKNGSIVARDWKFEKLNIVSADEAPEKCSRNVVDNIGCIEVIIIRCKGDRGSSYTHKLKTDKKPSESKHVSFDGTDESPDDYIGFDGDSRDWGYDDRSLHAQSRGASSDIYVNPLSGFAYVRPADTHRTHPPSRHASSHTSEPYQINESVANAYRASPAWLSRPPSIINVQRPQQQRSHSQGASPSVAGNSGIHFHGYTYGNGPIPATPRAPQMESQVDQFQDRTLRNIFGGELVDPAWLKGITEDAYKRGLEEAQRKRELDLHERRASQTTPPFTSTGGNPHLSGMWPPPPYEYPEAPPIVTSDGNKEWRRGISTSDSQIVGDTTDYFGSNVRATFSQPAPKESFVHNWAEGKNPYAFPLEPNTGGWEGLHQNIISPNSWTNSWGTKNSGNKRSSNTHRSASKSSDPWIVNASQSVAPSTTGGFPVQNGPQVASPRPTGAGDGWGYDDSETASSWSTMMSPREHIARSQSGTHNAGESHLQARPGENLSWSTSHEYNWPSAPGQEGKPSSLDPWSASASRIVPQSPMVRPPPYAPRDLFGITSRSGQSHAESGSDSWATSSKEDRSSSWRTDDQAPPSLASVKTIQSHISSSKSQGETASRISSKHRPTSNAGSNRAASNGNRDSQSVISGGSRTSQTMPGSWNDWGDSKDKSSATRTKQGSSNGRSAVNRSTSQNGSQSGIWETSNDNSDGKQDQTDDAWGGGYTSGWGAEESKDQTAQANPGWDGNEKAGSAEQAHQGASWGNGDWNGGDNGGGDAGEAGWHTNKEDNKTQNDDSGVGAWNAEADVQTNKDSSAQKEGSIAAGYAWNTGGWNTTNNVGAEDNQNDNAGGNASNTGGWDTANKVGPEDKQDDNAGGEAWTTGGGWDTTNNDGPKDNQNDNAGGDAWDIGKWNTTNNDVPEDKQNDNAGGDAWNAGGGWDTTNNNDGPKDNQNDNTGGDAWNVPAPNADNDKKSTTSSKSKTRLHSYRRPSSRSSLHLTPNHHWTFPPPPLSNKLYPIPEDIPTSNINTSRRHKMWPIPEEPLYTIPETKAKEKGLEHQVRAGKGTRYTHTVCRPEYLDSMDKPYAVFRFKYRSKDYLKKILGDELADGGPVIMNKGEDRAAAKKEEHKLKKLSEEQKINEIVKLKEKLQQKEKENEQEIEVGSVKAPTLLTAWVTEQQERSRKSVSKPNSLEGGWEKIESVKGSEKGDEVADLWAGQNWGNASQARPEKTLSKVESVRSSAKGSKKGEENAGVAWGQDWANVSQAGSKKTSSTRKVESVKSSGTNKVGGNIDGVWAGEGWAQVSQAESKKSSSKKAVSSHGGEDAGGGVWENMANDGNGGGGWGVETGGDGDGGWGAAAADDGAKVGTWA